MTKKTYLTAMIIQFFFFMVVIRGIKAHAFTSNATSSIPENPTSETEYKLFLSLVEAPFISIQIEPVAVGFSSVTNIANAGDERLFVTEQDGRILVVEPNGAVLPDPFLDIRSKIDIKFWEQGLLGLAFHPRYAENGYFFVNYTNKEGDTVVARYTADPPVSNTANSESELILLTIEQPDIFHNGGALAFSPRDGYLYIGVGDGGNRLAAQQGNQLLGKILRIDVDSATDIYAIPSTNPFIGQSEVRDEIWALGVRNPWRLTFDRQTGDMIFGDVGEKTREEINFQTVISGGGENYGWSCYEGSFLFQPAECNNIPYTFPVHEYEHGTSCSVTGGYIYGGEKHVALQGLYLFADLCSGTIWGLLPDNSGNWNVKTSNTFPLSWTTFGEDNSGELYIGGYHHNTIYRLKAGP